MSHVGNCDMSSRVRVFRNLWNRWEKTIVLMTLQKIRMIRFWTRSAAKKKLPLGKEGWNDSMLWNSTTHKSWVPVESHSSIICRWKTFLKASTRSRPGFVRYSCLITCGEQIVIHLRKIKHYAILNVTTVCPVKI